MAVAQGAPGEPRDVLLTSSEAFLLLPPQAIASNVVTRASWAPTGQAIAAVREITDIRLIGGRLAPERKGQGVYVWNRSSGRSVLVHQTSGEVDQLAWIAGSDLLYFVTREEVADARGNSSARLTLYRSTATGASAVAVRQQAGVDHPWILHASPFDSIALLLQTRISATRVHLPGELPAGGVATSVTLLRGNGTVSNPVDLPGGPLQVAFAPQSRIYFGSGREWHQLDPSTGAHSKLSEKPPLEVPERKSRFRPVTEQVSGIPHLYLQADNRMFLSARPTRFEMSPQDDALMIIVDGVALVRTMLRVPREEYEAARIAAERARLLSNVKQIGTAFHIYAADHDDVLPGPNPRITEMLMPYLKNESILQGFVYMFPGGNISNTRDPSKTVLGFIPGPGGRAEVYLDGHARWISD
ncbi:MAG TPA: hypothetical protein VM328_02135 [Fimbriimonadaceae bacterium]|nr:hypothetical protein [Fimbriimonadaceae bacterium]